MMRSELSDMAFYVSSVGEIVILAVVGISYGDLLLIIPETLMKYCSEIMVREALFRILPLRK
jgi:hypothetical protein